MEQGGKVRKIETFPEKQYHHFYHNCWYLSIERLFCTVPLSVIRALDITFFHKVIKKSEEELNRLVFWHKDGCDTPEYFRLNNNCKCSERRGK